MTNLPDLAADVAALAGAQGGRTLLGIAGAPASGKTTLARELGDAVADATVVPMDGFHLDDVILEARGHRDRKGAPHTFDVAGFCALLARLRTGEEVFAPEFDRSLEASRAAAIEVPTDAKIVIIEGNYLLHDRNGWEKVREHLDQCWYLDVAEEVLKARLEDRWTGFGMGRDEIHTKIEGNDLPNARLVAATRANADRVISF